ncbi:MAG: hypothetical protein QNK37_35185 [Acidobacteriota bacterium]|nr:hypothetical protein [Acidobacteriota bacterium]
MFDHLYYLAMLRLLALITTDRPLRELILNQLGETLNQCRSFISRTQWAQNAEDSRALREQAFRENGVTADVLEAFLTEEHAFHPHQLSVRLQEAQAIRQLLEADGCHPQFLSQIDQRLKAHLQKVNAVVRSES